MYIVRTSVYAMSSLYVHNVCILHAHLRLRTHVVSVAVHGRGGCWARIMVLWLDGSPV